jgi:N-methylhydantoinase B
MSLDLVTLEVLRNFFQAIVEDMARIMERTAHTTFVKETADFSTGLVSTTGEYVAYPWKLGASPYLGMNMIRTLRYFDTYEEGDVLICNDPYLSGPLCTHLPDVQILRPIFHEGRVVAWAYAFIHASDIGGTAPASVWPRATEIYQEGLRIRPTKLYRAGKLNEDVINLISDNGRVPDLNWGDIKAMLAAVGTCERRVHELIAKFGSTTVAEAMSRVLDYSEQRARSIIERIPDGRYEFADYLEDDLQSEVPVRIKLSLTVDGSELHLDFSGTDPQVGSALNLVTGGISHPFLCLAIIGWLVSVDPQIPKASGLLRPVRVTATPGTVVNAQPPSAVGVRFALVWRVFDTVMGALAQALPDRIPAASAGQGSVIVAAIPDPISGARHVIAVQPVNGGGGGRYDMDGLDACDSTSGYLRNTPVESLEAESPIIVRRYSLVPDTGGAGEHRGGLAVRLDFQIHHPDAITTMRGQERYKLQPWGIAGGRSGTCGSCFVNRDSDKARDVGKVDVLRLEPGDVVSVVTPAGGGRGDPRRREVRRVLSDVRAGQLSVDRARREYGVVITEGHVDEQATADVRSRMPAPSGWFDFGPGREQLERRWPPMVQDRVLSLLEELPPPVRDWGKHSMYHQIQQIAYGREPLVDDAQTAWSELRARLRRAVPGDDG